MFVVEDPIVSEKFRTAINRCSFTLILRLRVMLDCLSCSFTLNINSY